MIYIFIGKTFVLHIHEIADFLPVEKFDNYDYDITNTVHATNETLNHETIIHKKVSFSLILKMYRFLWLDFVF